MKYIEVNKKYKKNKHIEELREIDKRAFINGFNRGVVSTAIFFFILFIIILTLDLILILIIK